MKLVTPDSDVLWTPAKPVADLTTEVLPHIPFIREFLVRTNGLGIAAPQFGVPLRFFGWRNVSVSVITNPVIVSHSAETELKVEGCFSFPGKVTGRRRFKEITVIYTDEAGKTITRELKGLTARVFQHEIDHLNGINIFDRPKAG